MALQLRPVFNKHQDLWMPGKYEDLKKPLKIRRVINMTKKDDQMNMTKICEHDQKYNKYYHNDEP